MEKTAVTVTGNADLIRRLSQQLAGEGLPVSEPVPLASPSDVLNVPLGPNEIKEILELVTVIIEVATSAVTFATTLSSALAKGDRAEVRRAANNELLGTFNHQSSATDIKRILE